MKTSLKLAFLLLIAAPSLARAQALSPGFELERTGRYADAANVYVTIVRADPINIPALLGLERVLFVLNRMPELLPLVQRARVHAPDNPALRSLELRTYAALNEGDSLEAAALRWAATAPHSDAPYREWGLALVDHRMWDDARRAYLTGRKTLGGEGTLAIELAELEQRAGNWEASAREWARAVVRSPDGAPNAAAQLSESPPPLNDSDAQGSLRRFADLAGTLTMPEAHRVRGLALKRWADLVPWPLAARARAEAVRELLEGGDRVAARGVLERLATD